jgi:predicted solute-binding protein
MRDLYGEKVDLGESFFLAAGDPFPFALSLSKRACSTGGRARILRQAQDERSG